MSKAEMTAWNTDGDRRERRHPEATSMRDRLGELGFDAVIFDLDGGSAGSPAAPVARPEGL
ncbi:MAG TPA: hypothetical protein VF469_02605 [Kofleriaceae bacterium]